MSPDKARIITRAMAALPDTLTADEQAAVESGLVEKARRLSYEDLRRAARRALEVLDRDLADRAENTALEHEADRALGAADFWMRDSEIEGMVEGGFTLPALEADMLRSLLQAASAPRRAQSRALEPPTAGGPSFRQRQGLAFAGLVRRLPAGLAGDHGGVAATLVVTLDADTLRGTLDRAGTTSHGSRVPARDLRRLACDAGIVPMVLGGKSQILDLGRRKRLFSPAQRLALAHRDGGCAFPGCDRPPGWCEAHHLRPWAFGGTTNLADGVLLCGAHHRLIHRSDWEVRSGAGGMPEFVPPAHLDPTRTPRRNDRWRAA